MLCSHIDKDVGLGIKGSLEPLIVLITSVLFSFKPGGSTFPGPDKKSLSVRGLDWVGGRPQKSAQFFARLAHPSQLAALLSP